MCMWWEPGGNQTLNCQPKFFATRPAENARKKGKCAVVSIKIFMDISPLQLSKLKCNIYLLRIDFRAINTACQLVSLHSPLAG